MQSLDACMLYVSYFPRSFLPAATCCSHHCRALVAGQDARSALLALHCTLSASVRASREATEHGRAQLNSFHHPTPQLSHCSLCTCRHLAFVACPLRAHCCSLAHGAMPLLYNRLQCIRNIHRVKPLFPNTYDTSIELDVFIVRWTSEAKRSVAHTPVHHVGKPRNGRSAVS